MLIDSDQRGSLGTRLNASTDLALILLALNLFFLCRHTPYTTMASTKMSIDKNHSMLARNQLPAPNVLDAPGSSVGDGVGTGHELIEHFLNDGGPADPRMWEQYF